MPELPEVETVVRTLRPNLVGDRFVAVHIEWAKSIAHPATSQFVAELCGTPDDVSLGMVRRVFRRAKYIIMSLESNRHLIIHLRMTGRLILYPTWERARVARHARVSFAMASGRGLAFEDMRKFGRLWLVDDPELVVGDLGPEPLTSAFTPELFWNLLRRRRQIKPLLLDQHVLAGLGNIYVDESLWRAGIHPLRLAHTLTYDEAQRLCAAVRATLSEAVARKGTTLRDYRDADGAEGSNQHTLAVYGREGNPCPRCSAPVQRTMVGSRGTHICPVCQSLDQPQPPAD